MTVTHRETFLETICPPPRETNIVWWESRSAFRVDSPLFDCFVLVHVDGGNRVLGAGLHLPVHLPLGILGLGLEQVHPFLRFDPAGNSERRKEEWDSSILLEAMIYVQGQRWTPSVCSRPPSCIASWQKQFHRWINNRDEWRWQCSDTWDQKARTASGHAVHPLDIYTLLLNHWQLKASNFSAKHLHL